MAQKGRHATDKTFQSQTLGRQQETESGLNNSLGECQGRETTTKGQNDLTACGPPFLVLLCKEPHAAEVC